MDDINEMLKRGVDVRLVTLKKEKSGASLAEECAISEDNWKIVEFSGVFDFRSWRKLIQIIKELNPEVVITHLWFANTVGRVSSFLAGAPKIISFEHNIYDEVKGQKQFFIDRVLSAITNRIVAVSEAVKESLLRHGIPEKKIVVILNGINTGKYSITDRTVARKRLGLTEEEFIFSFVGRLTKQKGADILLKALSRLDGGSLIIAGNGEERDELEKMAKKLGIAGRVKFLGVVKNVPEVLAASDCFVLPSRWEGLGIVLLEAMAAGKPIIASRVGGIKEIVIENENGILASAGSDNELAGAMIRLMGDGGLRKRLADNNKKSAGKFSIENHVNQLLQLINNE